MQTPPIHLSRTMFTKLTNYIYPKEDSDGETLEISPDTREDTGEDTGEDTDSDTDSDEERLSDVITSARVAHIGKAFYYETTARDLVELPRWTYQRCIDPGHVNSLLSDLSLSKHFIGTFKALRDSEGSLKLMDGQHRMAACREMMKLDPRWNMDVMLEVYDTDSFDSGDSFKMFEKANNVKNVDSKDFPLKVAATIIKRCKNKWPGMLVRPREGKRVNRPRLDTRTLYRRLKDHLPDKRIGLEELWKEITQANSRLGLCSHKTFGCSHNTLKKARSAGFYLGLQKDLEWLDHVLLHEE